MDYCDSLALFPDRGRRREDLAPGLRVTNHRSRISILFDVDASKREVAIYSVHYGGQNYEAAY